MTYDAAHRATTGGRGKLHARPVAGVPIAPCSALVGPSTGAPFDPTHRDACRGCSRYVVAEADRLAGRVPGS